MPGTLISVILFQPFYSLFSFLQQYIQHHDLLPHSTDYINRHQHHTRRNCLGYKTDIYVDHKYVLAVSSIA